MTTYNHENWIEFGINSIINQSYKNFEIIVIDDHSTDSTFSKINQFKNSNIRAVQNKQNIGCSRSMNNIMNHLSSKYAAMTSGDDAWMKEKLEAQVEFMETHPDIDLCFTDSLTLNSLNEIGPRFPFFNPENKDRPQWISGLFGGNFIPGMSVMFRNSSWFIRNRFDPTLRQLQDWEYWIRALSDGLKFHILQSPLTLYRVLPDSLSNQNSSQKDARSRFEVISCLNSFKRISSAELRTYFHHYFVNEPLYDLDRSTPVCLAILASKINQTPYHQFAAQTLQTYFRDGDHMIDDLVYHNFIGSLNLLAVN